MGEPEEGDMLSRDVSSVLRSIISENIMLMNPILRSTVTPEREKEGGLVSGATFRAYTVCEEKTGAKSEGTCKKVEFTSDKQGSSEFSPITLIIFVLLANEIVRLCSRMGTSPKTVIKLLKLLKVQKVSKLIELERDMPFRFKSNPNTGILNTREITSFESSNTSVPLVISVVGEVWQ